MFCGNYLEYLHQRVKSGFQYKIRKLEETVADITRNNGPSKILFHVL